MSIEEAEYILNEVVITEPSINSYTYISTEEINQAIDKLLEKRLKDEKRIKELEKENNELGIEIRKIELNIEKNKNEKYKEKHINKVIKYIKKVVKPLFYLKLEEN